MLTRGLSDKVGCIIICLTYFIILFIGNIRPIFAISPSFSAGEYIRQNELKCLKLSFVNNSIQENSKRYYILSCKCRGAKQKQYVPKKPYIQYLIHAGNPNRRLYFTTYMVPLPQFRSRALLKQSARTKFHEGYMNKKITSHKYCMIFCNHEVKQRQ